MPSDARSTGGGWASVGAGVPSRERGFLERARVAHLATADPSGAPHVVPVCFVLDAGSLYITIDEKPKRAGAKLKRLANIERNPRVAVIADQYDEDWSRLAWVMVRGAAAILEAGEEHDRAQALLRSRYPQYCSMALEALPVIAVRIGRVSAWGAIDAP